LKFVPLIEYGRAITTEPTSANYKCSWRDEALHFWTVFGAIIVEFMLFGSVYLWTLIKSKTKSKWRNGLAGCFILCFVVVLLASICLRVGRKRLFRRLLLEVSKY